MNNQIKMLNVKDVSEIFQKSQSWVYKNWKKLGGIKCSGSLVFPHENDIYNNIFKDIGTITNLNCFQNKVQTAKTKPQKIRKRITSKQYGGKYKTTVHDRHNVFGR
ncbi:hypothetical protein MHK_008716 [Candidatus Magnetomorum sp. HK-1]|nr:hypothetical protein MHK_008716 [Candidatus Magnetomorum sp. HK-1]